MKPAKPTTYVRIARKLAADGKVISPGQVAYVAHKRREHAYLCLAAAEGAAETAIRESGLFKRELSSFDMITLYKAV